MRRRFELWQNKVVLVTGASRGIGKALADRLAEVGARLVLTGRDERSFSLAGRLSAAGIEAYIWPLTCEIRRQWSKWYTMDSISWGRSMCLLTMPVLVFVDRWRLWTGIATGGSGRECGWDRCILSKPQYLCLEDRVAGW